MNKIVKYLLTVMLTGSVVCSSNTVIYATEVNEITNDVVVDGVEEAGDDVVITSEDKPYLALGADLSADQNYFCHFCLHFQTNSFDSPESSSSLLA